MRDVPGSGGNRRLISDDAADVIGRAERVLGLDQADAGQARSFEADLASLGDELRQLSLRPYDVLTEDDVAYLALYTQANAQNLASDVALLEAEGVSPALRATTRGYVEHDADRLRLLAAKLNRMDEVVDV